MEREEGEKEIERMREGTREGSDTRESDVAAAATHNLKAYLC